MRKKAVDDFLLWAAVVFIRQKGSKVCSQMAAL
jgi:hypothetical protein